MTFVRKGIMFLLICALLSGCVEIHSKTKNVREEFKEQQQDESNVDKLDEEADEQFEVEVALYPKTPVTSPFDSDGNFHVHQTEVELQEMFSNAELIFLHLNEHPIRKITDEEGITTIRNYSDTVIDVLAEEAAYVLQDTTVLNNIIQEITDATNEEEMSPIHFRTWEDMSNTERGLIQLIGFVEQYLEIVEAAIQEEQFESEHFKLVREQLEILNSTSVIVPTPQTASDEQLFEQAIVLKSLWGQLGKFDDLQKYPERYEDTFYKTNEEMQNLLLLLAEIIKK